MSWELIILYSKVFSRQVIAKNSSIKHIIYSKAGKEYYGAMDDVVNLNHVPSVTCEVLMSHGKLA